MVEDLPDSSTRELKLAEAFSHVPGYIPGDPSIETVRLSGGSVNRSYSVFTPAGRFVLRLSRGPDAWLTTDRSVERELHRIAARALIAPRIVAADPDDWWMVTEYVTGRLWMEPDFANPQRLARLGDTLRRLHELPPPDIGRFDLLQAMSRYAERVGAEAAYLDWAAAAWRVSGADERPLAILHHDLHGSNLIETTHRLVLIDWECAAVSDPLLDVACILSYHESARPHASRLLRHSGLEYITSRQLAAAVWLFDLHTYLWYRERRLRRSATEAERDAEEQLAERLPRTLEDWRSGTS
jgi:aminoglycoside phosphotransferase (APT) family kinase protein